MRVLDRRALLAGAGTLAALVPLGALARAPTRRVRAIGLQLYSVRAAFAKDPVGTLEQVARIGYREVEFANGYEKMDHAMLRRTIDRLGLKAPSLHIQLPMLTDQLDASIAMARKLGAETVVMPWLPPAKRVIAGPELVIPTLNRIGAALAKEGLSFAYHNHDFEFAVRDDHGTMFDRLVTDVDPALMRFELDLYWATHGGQEVPALIDRLGSRLFSFHVKDMTADREIAAVGTGTIDFAALLGRKAAAGVRHFYVENDNPPPPYFPDVTTSFRNLSALRF